MDEIATAIAKFRDAYNAGDVQAIAAYYSESLVKLREGAPPEGKAEVIRRIESTFRDFAGHLEVANDEIGAGGDLTAMPDFAT
jgi:ketosteroid isomerase-like protein